MKRRQTRGLGASRAHHEDFARQAITQAQALRPWLFGCDARALNTLVKMSSALGRARAHLASIGPGPEGPRTRKLWAIEGQLERAFDRARAEMALCLRTGSRSSR
jgi:hypothetical protein